MSEIKKFDAIIIGSGQSGNPLMFELSKRGQSVAMIEKNKVGGSCINYGCTPTKTLIASSNLNHRMDNSKELGIITKDLELDFKKVMNRKNDIVKSFRGSIENSIENNENIELFMGTGSFIDKNTVKVDLNNGEIIKIQGDKIYINTGSKPNIIPLDGLESVDFYDSTSIMELTELPEHLVIIGTGYIALEFSQMFRRFGSKVTVIGRSEHIIKKEDQDVSNRMQEILEEDDIVFFLNADTKRIEKNGEKTNIFVEKNGEKKEIECSHLMLATGRVSGVDNLKLENTNVKLDEKGNIKVNDKLKTDEDNIYALGDVKGGPQFTHIAYDDYRILIDNLYGEGKRTIKDRYVPFTLFTQPQLGRVGLTEREAREQGYDIDVNKIEMSTQGRTIEENYPKGFIKAVVNKENHEILGASALSYQGGEMMAMIEIAMMGSMKYEKLRDGIFTHPSLSESLNNLFNI